MNSRSKCRRCGTKFEGKGGLCLACLAHSPALDGHPAKAAPAAGRAVKVAEGGPICPYCRAELSWDTIGSSETEATIYVCEKMYYCPSCRALLGFSSWHTEG